MSKAPEDCAQARYETIGRSYSRTRRTDPAIMAQISAALADSSSVVNVGAGAGSYEPEGMEVIAIEPSPTMAAQRPASRPAVIGYAEDLPLTDDCSDAAMTVLSVHHWSDLAAGLQEMRRVARNRVLVLTLDPEVLQRSWVREYAPALREMDVELPPIDRIAELLGGAEVSMIPVPADCEDIFIETSLSRPEILLDPVVRANCSGFARMGDEAEGRAVAALRADLNSGEWDRRFGSMRDLSEFDGGLRLLVAGTDS